MGMGRGHHHILCEGKMTWMRRCEGVGAALAPGRAEDSFEPHLLGQAPVSAQALGDGAVVGPLAPQGLRLLGWERRPQILTALFFRTA